MQKKKIILYGAGRRAEMLLGCSGWKEQYRIVSVVDSDERRQGKQFGG